MLYLEGSSAVGCAESGWTIITGFGGTQIGAAATAIAPAGHVIEITSVAIERRGCIDAAGVACQGVDASDDGRGDAGAAKDQPATNATVRIVNGNASVWVGNG